MNISNVIVSDEIDKKGIEILDRNGLKVTYKPDIEKEELLKIIKDYDILIVRSRTKVLRDVIDASNLKIIARVGVGLDNIDVKYAKEKGISVINAEEAAMSSVAELVIGLMIGLARGITKADTSMKNGKWIKKELVGYELKGKYLGIIGVGKIGKRVGRIAKALGMNLIGYDVVQIDKEFVRETNMITADLDTLLKNADYITLHVPLTEQTRHMLNKDKLMLMKKSAYIINTSRGGVIDEDALYHVLKDGMIAGAALDVFEEEPPRNIELVRLSNVICTPHIGAQTKEAQELASTIVAEKIIQKLRE
ncbi:MAG: D-2-hydroxyacid dehydrogenase [Candidatus Nitrosocaldaceae archaeon]